ncbi:MAG: hypothetical protein Q7T20_01700, partial [Saprospiraceae bacterium]|nr:hypothetical protein [Saprospiraceae bacterium]
MTPLLLMGRRFFVCLLLTIFISLKVNAQEICPVYPRAMDQAYLCLKTEYKHFAFLPPKLEYSLSLEQNATLHNPVRFTFPEIPPNVTVSFDAGDGIGFRTVSSSEILTVSYPTPGQIPLIWTIEYIDPDPHWGLSSTSGLYS